MSNHRYEELEPKPWSLETKFCDLFITFLLYFVSRKFELIFSEKLRLEFHNI